MNSRKRPPGEGDRESQFRVEVLQEGYQPNINGGDQPTKKLDNPKFQTGNQPSAPKGGGPANSPVPPKEE